jgi:L-serine dehydratase
LLPGDTVYQAGKPMIYQGKPVKNAYMTPARLSDHKHPWQPQTFLPYHPNGMKFVGKDLNGDIIDEWTVYSIGGGAISDGTAGNEELGAKDVYDLNKLADIKQWCYDNGRSFWEYVEKCESEDIWDYLDMVWQTMKQSIRNGLDHEGVLPGPLNRA